jgi:hypothetical protein
MMMEGRVADKNNRENGGEVGKGKRTRKVTC